MIVTRKHLPRRTVLRGLGATIALPLLDGMIPAFAAQRTTAAQPVRRLGVVYVPNGIVMSDWTPATEGASFDLTPILQPLAPFRDRMVVLTGINNGQPHYVVHGAASTRFLTTVPPQASTGSIVEAGISMDQVAAKALGQHTQLASLELALEAPQAGACDVGASCVYTDTIAWRGTATPLPMEHNPRAVFERLFGDNDSTDRAARAVRFTEQRSILDSVTETVADLRRELGARDQAKINEYLEAVRDIERRIQRAEEQDTRELPAVERPVGVPDTFPEHARLMFDLQVLAYQSDLTRVITFMVGRELSGRNYPEIGVGDAHHPISHHQGNREKLAKLTKISVHHAAQLAYFLERLQSTPDGDGSLLDHLTIVYGGGMSDGDAHAPQNLPLLLMGGGAGQLTGGRHLRFSPDTPIANLHLTLLEKLGLQTERFGNSTGTLAGL
jgi:hypothetical protein